MLEWLQDVSTIDPTLTLAVIAGRIMVAAALGLVVTLVYLGSQRRSVGEVFPLASTLILLTVLVAMTTLVIGNSFARAFSLVGVLSIVRFRTIVEDTRDTAFVIFAVVVGMASGAGDLRVCAAGMPVVAAASLSLYAIEKYTRRLHPERKLEVRIGRDLDPCIVLQPVFQDHLVTHRLVSATTAKQGQSVELKYMIRLTNTDGVLALLRSLQTTSGVECVEINGTKTE